MNEDILKANVLVHTRMAESYNQSEPHYRPENREKVRRHLVQLRNDTEGRRLLDLGCGTGFIIDLAKDLFDEIDGVDITSAMLDRVDLNGGTIRLHNTTAQDLPFENESFDAITAYAFLHHLEDYRPVLSEMARVLCRGGRAYVDLEPNKLFWQHMSVLESNQHEQETSYPEVVQREIDSVLHTDKKVQMEFGIEPEMFNLAEYTKSILGGIDPLEFSKDAKDAGFSRCDVHPEWFLGQGSIMHSQSFEAAEKISSFLLSIYPASAHLYKYLRFQLVH
jgi:ubiquinone/menaquinone biosynthesis C-methylase UbiE